jgi:hypothetical protein
LSKKRDTLEDPISASAGQCLGFYPVFKCVLAMQDITTAEVREAITCFNNLCDVIDMLKRAATPGKVRPAKLHKAIATHLEQFKKAHGVGAWVPKFHLPLHLPEMLEHFDVLLSCFVMERKHKEVKRFGDISRAVSKDTLNTTWDQNLLKNILRVHLDDLVEGRGLPTGTLTGSWKKPTQSVLAACQHLGLTDVEEMAINVVIRGYIHVHAGDVVDVQLDTCRCTAEVWFHLKTNGSFKTCISVWQSLPSKNMYMVQDAPVLVDTDSILYAMTYRRVESTVLVVR